MGHLTARVYPGSDTVQHWYEQSLNIKSKMAPTRHVCKLFFWSFWRTTASKPSVRNRLLDMPYNIPNNSQFANKISN